MNVHVAENGENSIRRSANDSVGHAPDNLIKEESGAGGAGKSLIGCFAYCVLRTEIISFTCPAITVAGFGQYRMVLLQFRSLEYIKL